MLSRPTDKAGCKHTVVYFYCSFQDSSTYDAGKFLKSILAQLFIKHDAFPELVQVFHNNQPYPVSQNELREALAAVISNPNPKPRNKGLERETDIATSNTITLIIDALDEVPSGFKQKQFFSVLEFLAQLNAPDFRLIVFSRASKGIQQHLKKQLGWSWMRRSDEDVEIDIDLFPQKQILEHAILNERPDRIKLSIRKCLGQGKTGMFVSDYHSLLACYCANMFRFRLAALQMQELCENTQGHDGIDEEGILYFLDNMPREIDLYYDRILSRIPTAMQKYLKIALQWIRFSYRPMFVEEMVAACAIIPNGAGRAPSVGIKMADASSILEWLRGMVELHPSPVESCSNLPYRTHTLHFVHQSVKEYFFPVLDFDRPAGELRFEASSSHKFLAQCCLAYILHSARGIDGRSSAYPLRAYSWYSWARHVVSSASSDAEEAISRLDSLKMHNSVVHPLLYKSPGESRQDIVQIRNTFDEFIQYLSPESRAQLKSTLQDTSFPGSVTEDEWDWQIDSTPIGENVKPLRLLMLQASEKHDANLECSLLHESLENRPCYEAVTYTWDRVDDSEGMTVNGRKFYVQPKVFSILKALRSRSKARILWLDSIRINMKDRAEHSQQVALTTEIYSNAFQNAVWFDDGNPHGSQAIRSIQDRAFAGRLSVLKEASTAGLELLNSLTVPDDSPDMLSSPPLNKAKELASELAELTNGMHYLITRPLWRRVWVIQEISVAKELIFYCGEDILPWEDWIKSLTLFKSFLKGVTGNQNLGWVPKLSDTDMLTGLEAVTMISFLRTEYQAGHEISLPKLLWLSRLHVAEDPRDKLNAILNLYAPEERNNPLLKADYRVPVREVYSKLATYIVRKYQNLDILSFAEPLPVDERRKGFQWSSWVPLWYITNDPLCPGIFWPEQPELYNAGGRRLHRFNISETPSYLTVEGIHVNTVVAQLSLIGVEFDYSAEGLGSVACWHKLLQSSDICVEALCKRYPNRDDFVQARVRTLLTDKIKGSDGK